MSSEQADQWGDGSNCFLSGPPESRSRQRKLGIAKYTPLAGSQKLPCTLCGHKTWLGPKQLAFLAAHPKSKIVCGGCVVAGARAGDRPKGLMTLGQAGGDYWLTDGRHIGQEPKS